VRAINDALTGILFVDDCQVVSMSVSKDYGDERRPGAYIVVSRYTNQKERAKKTRKKAQPKEEVSAECPCDDPRDD
jgi:hypothetical protein